MLTEKLYRRQPYEVPHQKSTRNRIDASRKKSTRKYTASGKISKNTKGAVDGADNERKEGNNQRSGKAVPKGKEKGEERDVK